MYQFKNYLINLYKKHQDIGNIFLMVFVTIVVFYNSMGAYFSEVDDLNSILHSDRNWGKIFVTNTYGYNLGGNYRPIEVISHQIDKQLFGDDDIVGRHFTNIIVHIFNLILVYFLAGHFTKKKWIGLMSGLLFAIHIVHGNSLPPVAWISGRVDPFVTFFLLLTLLMFIKFLSTGSKLFYLISFITFIFALWSKEMAFIFPLVIVLYLYLFTNIKNEEQLTTSDTLILPWITILGGVLLILIAILFNPHFAANFLSPDGSLHEGTITKINSYRLLSFIIGGFACGIFVLIKLFRRVLRVMVSFKYSFPYFIILFLFLMARIEILGGIGGNYNSKDGKNVVFQLGIDSFMRDIYALIGLVLPVGADYNISIFRLQVQQTFLFYLIGILVLIALLSIFIWLIKTKSNVLAFFYLWTFINLMPVHNSLIASGQYQSRYLYLSSVGFCIFMSIIFYKFTQSKYIPSRLSKAIIIFLMIIILTFNSFFIIKNNEKLVMSGDIMSSFVSDMKRYQHKISEAKKLYFITFPISPINSMDAVFSSIMLEEPLNYIDIFEGYGKRYNYSILLYDQSEAERKHNLIWLDDRNFIVDGINYQSSYIIPKELADLGKQIEKIYKGRPHARLESFSSIGEIKETKNDIVKVLELVKENATTKLAVEFNEQFIFPKGSTLFFLYAEGHFDLVKEIYVPSNSL